MTIARPGIALDGRGYTSSYTDNLVPSVVSADFEADLRQGSGNELAGKFCV